MSVVGTGKMLNPWRW